MSIWNIYYKPEETPLPVKVGFNWVAFFFPVIWALTKGMLTLSSLGIALVFATIIMPDPYFPAFLIFVLMIICGFKGNEWVCTHLEKNGYRMIEVLEAYNKEHAYNEACKLVYAGNPDEFKEQSRPQSDSDYLADNQTTSDHQDDNSQHQQDEHASGHSEGVETQKKTFLHQNIEPKTTLYKPGMLWALLVLTVILGGGIIIAKAWPSGPKNYDECILENMQGVDNDRAVLEVRRACRELFPPVLKLPTSRDLTREEINNLTGRAGLRLGDTFGGTIYNGNENITVSQITIGVKTDPSEDVEYQKYTTSATISPLSTSDFTVRIIKGDDNARYHWTIISAKGHN